jgi:uncharacterized membrane protein
MQKVLASYGAVLVAIVALDALWLGVVAKPLYRNAIGHLMADEPRLWAGALFYAIFAVGLMMFVVLPVGATAGWGKTALTAGLFGFFAYATYDLTNLATLKQWPLWLSLVDLAWGSAVSAIAATAGSAVLKWLGTGGATAG